MRIILGFFIILLFWALGTVVAHFTGRIIPGSVLGMLLLFVGLATKLVKPAMVREVAGFLTKNMSLFFIPAGVGLMAHLGVLKQGWQFIVVASVVSTIAVMLTVALIQEKGEKKNG